MTRGSSDEGRMWERAYERIRQEIFQRQLKPGETLSELGLSKRLGISRTPVREALNKLEIDGLVVTHNHRKRVNIITIREINEIFELKKAIESHMALLAARQASDEQLESFSETIELMRKFAERDFARDEDRGEHMRIWAQLDERFHSQIFAMAGNQRAAQIISSLNSQWHRIRMGLLAMEGRLAINVQEHLAMGESLLARHEMVGDLMGEHLEKLRRTLTSIMEAFQIPS